MYSAPILEILFIILFLQKLFSPLICQSKFRFRSHKKPPDFLHPNKDEKSQEALFLQSAAYFKNKFCVLVHRFVRSLERQHLENVPHPREPVQLHGHIGIHQSLVQPKGIA